MSALPDGGASARELLFGRFAILEALGTGGFGHVWRALDTETGGVVAVKELYRFSGDALLAFKREFRALADAHHPSLVRLGELFESEGRWGFSMEYVPGTDLLTWIRDFQLTGFDEGRLRRGFCDLARALVALHRMGLFHRDVKPQNVRVTPEGRVVLLDFGLVMHAGAVRDPSETSGGTAAYMAPEQALDEPLREASDFYALGVLLYEALTGELPFEGNALEIMLAKHRRDPVPPSTRKSGLPADLDALCIALLARDPEQRPSGTEVVLALSSPSSGPAPAVPVEVMSADDVFVGRASELSALEGWFERSRRDDLAVVLVEGESGVGKSSLVQRFARRLALAQASLLKLEGRCHAAEQVPFKMFDGVVDELSRHLLLLERSTAEALVPDEAGLLPTLFPVLGRVEAVTDRAARARRRTDRLERISLFRALSDLLHAIGARQPLLLVVDDLQWGDEESISLLRALLDAPKPARALLVATVRPLESVEGSLGEGLRQLATHPRVHRLPLAPLARDEASELVASCLGTPVDDPRVHEIVTEAGGHPLFISELSARAEPKRGEALTLDEALFERCQSLDDTARRMLEVLAVAGAPTPLRVLAHALRADAEKIEQAVTVLRVARLARVVRRGELACYHDRLREALIARLDPDVRRTHHALLAEASSAGRERDAADIARHWLGAGALDRALPWLTRAADEAMGKAAFEKAVELLRTLLERCAEHVEAEGTYRFELMLSDALASAGRCAESARVLLGALDRASPEQRRELRVRAAQRLLQAGEVNEGIEAAQQALEEVGLSWPRSTASTVTRLLWHRSYLAIRGLGSKARSDDEVSDSVRAQLDTLWRLWQPMLWADMLRGAELSARHLSLALREGPVRHTSFALCGEAVLLSVQGSDKNPCAELLERHAAQGAEVHDPEIKAYRRFAQGYVKFLAWQVGEAAFDLAAAERLYRQECPSEAWMLANVRGALLAAWYNLGEQRRSGEVAERWIAEAEARGDRFAFASCSVLGLGALRHLLRDQPELALAEVKHAMAPFSTGPIGGQHLGELSVVASTHMYIGGTAPYAYWQDTWPRFKSSFLARARFARDLFRWCRADAAVRAALVEEGALRARLLGEARQLLRGIPADNGPVMRSLLRYLDAQLQYIDGNRDAARELAAEAYARLAEVGHYLRWTTGLFLAHVDPSRSTTQAHEGCLNWLRSQGWTNTDRALRMGIAAYPMIEAQS